MNWKPEVCVSGKWCGNNLVFSTKQEAEGWGIDRLMKWWVPTDSRAVETSDPVNYKWENGKIQSIS